MRYTVAKEFYRSGKTLKEIAREHGVKIHSVKNFANNFEKEVFSLLGKIWQ